MIGKKIIDGFSDEFKRSNHGRYIAITMQGKIISLQDTLTELNDDLGNKKLPKEYYVARLGYDTITTI